MNMKRKTEGKGRGKLITKNRQRKTRRNQCVLDQRAMGRVDLCGSLLRSQRVLVLQMNGVKFKHCWRRGDASSHEILLSFLEIGNLDRTPKYNTVTKCNTQLSHSPQAQSPNEQGMELGGEV